MPEEVHSDSSVEMLDEDVDVGQSPKGWESIAYVICCLAESWTKFRGAFAVPYFFALIVVMVKAGLNLVRTLPLF